MMPQQVRQMTDDDFLLFVDSKPGKYIPARRKPFWKMECGGLASPDPYHPAGQRLLGSAAEVVPVGH
jgi:hypothetical protein